MGYILEMYYMNLSYQSPINTVMVSSYQLIQLPINISRLIQPNPIKITYSNNFISCYVRLPHSVILETKVLIFSTKCI